eukprot:50411-Pleurochrysis_carterae.AAC.1
MVVDEDEQVLVATSGRDKWAGDVRVNDAAGVARLVLGSWVRKPRCIGGGACVAWANGRPTKCGWCVGRDVGQGAQAVVAGV